MNIDLPYLSLRKLNSDIGGWEIVDEFLTSSAQRAGAELEDCVVRPDGEEGRGNEDIQVAKTGFTRHGRGDGDSPEVEFEEREYGG